MAAPSTSTYGTLFCGEDGWEYRDGLSGQQVQTWGPTWEPTWNSVDRSGPAHGMDYHDWQDVPSKTVPLTPALDYLEPRYRHDSAHVPAHRMRARRSESSGARLSLPRPATAGGERPSWREDPRAARQASLRRAEASAAQPVWQPPARIRNRRAEREERRQQKLAEQQQRAARIKELEEAIARGGHSSLLRSLSPTVPNQEPEPAPEPAPKPSPLARLRVHSGPPDNAPQLFHPSNQRTDLRSILKSLEACLRDFDASLECVMAVDACCTRGGASATREFSQTGGMRAIVKALRLHCDGGGGEVAPPSEADKERYRRLV
eukprot:COSAG05_NODE_5564_length_1139_cov_1.333654_1_plen_318_part_01